MLPSHQMCGARRPEDDWRTIDVPQLLCIDVDFAAKS